MSWLYSPLEAGTDVISRTIRQEINIIDTIVTASGDHSALVQLDTTKYPDNVIYFFEIVATVASGTLTVALERSGTATQDAIITVTETSFTRKRVILTPPAAAQTVYQINLSGGTTPQVKAARIIIIQDFEIFNTTQTQIEIGNQELSKTNTSASALSNPKYWYFDSSKWDGTLSVSAEVTWLKNGVGSAMPTIYNVGAVAASQNAIAPGLPTDTQADDILVMVLETNNEAITVAGWTEAANSPQSDATDATRLTVFWKRATGGADATTTSDSGNHQIGRIIGVRGCITSGDPWDNTAGTTDATSDTSGNFPTFSTSVDNCMVIWACCTGDDGNSTTEFTFDANASVANLTERIDNKTNQQAGGGIGAATGEKASAGSIGNQTVQYANASRKGLWVGALKPAGLNTTVTITLQEDDGNFANWSNKITIVNADNTAGTVTRTRSSTFTPVTGRNYRLASSISNSSHNYDIFNAKIIINSTFGSTQTEQIEITETATNESTLNGGTGTSGETGQAHGQAFYVDSSFYCKRIDVHMKKSGSPTDNLTVKIISDSITGASLGTSDNVDGSTLPTTAAWITFTFSTPIYLLSGTIYYIHLERSGAYDITNRYTTSFNDLSVYSQGRSYARNNNSWSAWFEANDFLIRIFQTETVNKLETQYLLANTTFAAGTSLQDFDTRWDPGEWQVDSISYIHEGNSVASGTSDIKLQDTSGPTDVTNSSITDVIEREQSVGMTMPTGPATIDVIATSNVSTLNGSRILAQSTAVVPQVDFTPDDPMGTKGIFGI